MLTISGEHDLNTAPELRSQLDEAMKGDRGVVVDLSPATFVDSSILGVILDGRRRAAAADRGFAVAQGSGAEAVTRVLEITGLRAELPVYESREQAESQASGGDGPGG